MSIPLVIIIICWIICIFYWLVSAFSVKRDIGGGWWGEWRSGWWVRIMILVAIIIFVHFFSHSSFSSSGFLGRYHDLLSQPWLPTTNPIHAVIGPLLCILGIALAIWARVHLGRNWSSHPTLKENHELVTSGPYTLIRHPIYTGLILAALGTGLVIWPWIVVFLGMLAMFTWRVKKEEALMTTQFPNQYPEYKKRTWALIPWVW